MGLGMIGVVLAGGLSTRMGQDKALLRWQGQSLLEHMRALLHSAGCERVVVSGLQDYPDRQQDAGPLAGIARLMAEFPDQRLLFVPVDMPLLKPDSLQSLLNASELVYFNRCYLPLAVTAGARVCETIAACLASEAKRGRSIRAWLELNQAQSLALADEESLANANTPEQWQKLLELGRR